MNGDAPGRPAEGLSPAGADRGCRFYRTVRRLFRLLVAPLYRMKVEGADHVPATGPGVLVALHRSWLDPPSIGAACPRPVHFLIKDRVYHRRLGQWFYRRMESFPVATSGRHAAGGVRRALRVLHRGKLVGIFPEGTVRRAGDPVEVFPGAAMLAVRARAPVIPVEIRGTARAWPRGQRLPRLGKILVRFHPAIVPPGGGKDAVGALAAEIRDILLDVDEDGVPPRRND